MNKKIILIIFILILTVTLYLMLNVAGVPVPLPKWYKESIKRQVDSSMVHDPFLNLAKTTVKYRDERDSLQHIIDSLKSK
jgi:hypothetical protein